MTIKRPAFSRDGGAQTQRNNISGNKFANSVKSTVSDLTTRVDESFAYEPADVADWDNSAPATIREALDRIAKKITPVPV